MRISQKRTVGFVKASVFGLALFGGLTLSAYEYADNVKYVMNLNGEWVTNTANHAVLITEENFKIPREHYITDSCGIYVAYVAKDVFLEKSIYLADDYGTNAYRLIVADGATLTIDASQDKINPGGAGLRCAEGAEVHICGGEEGTGRLILQGNTCGAGIGGGDNQNCGRVYIHGCEILATGGEAAAGVGGGAGKLVSGDYTGKGPEAFVIYGGSLVAKGGIRAAGIGGGSFGKAGTPDIEVYGESAKLTAIGGLAQIDGDLLPAIGPGAGGEASDSYVNLRYVASYTARIGENEATNCEYNDLEFVVNGAYFRSREIPGFFSIQGVADTITYCEWDTDGGTWDDSAKCNWYHPLPATTRKLRHGQWYAVKQDTTIDHGLVIGFDGENSATSRIFIAKGVTLKVNGGDNEPGILIPGGSNGASDCSALMVYTEGKTKSDTLLDVTGGYGSYDGIGGTNRDADMGAFFSHNVPVKVSSSHGSGIGKRPSSDTTIKTAGVHFFGFINVIAVSSDENYPGIAAPFKVYPFATSAVDAFCHVYEYATTPAEGYPVKSAKPFCRDACNNTTRYVVINMEGIPGTKDIPWIVGNDKEVAYIEGNELKFFRHDEGFSLRKCYDYAKAEDVPWFADLDKISTVSVPDGSVLGQNMLSAMNGTDIKVMWSGFKVSDMVKATTGMSGAITPVTAESVQVVDGKLWLDVGVEMKNDFTDEDWTPVDFDGVGMDPTTKKVWVSVPVSGKQGFFMLKSKDAKK